ncbi:MAG TPA: hypothetical protein VM925_11020 [Labilithrix sp.]|nr:hypothetical protein [Labilithrix sp.]
MSARGRSVLLAAVAILGACGPAKRNPSTPVAAAEAGDSGTADDAGTEADAGVDAEPSTEVADAEEEPSSPCPRNMVLVATSETRFCIDKYEASLVEVESDGTEKPFAHWLPVDGHVVRAVSEPDVFPQGFISEVQAEDACAASGKRLCSYPEWKTACMGPAKSTFPYGDARRPGVCHDNGKSAVYAVFGARTFTDPAPRTATNKPQLTPGARGAAPAPSKAGAVSKPGVRGAPKATGNTGRQAHVTTKGRAAVTTKPRAARPGAAKPPLSKQRPDRARTPDRRTRPAPAKSSTRPASVEPSIWTQLNDPRLGKVDGALAKTGAHEACESGYGAVDMVGNLHEWVKTDPSAVHGTFAGGYYLDTSLNGDGCQYRTTAHAHDYHDYSTGFRCCAGAKSDEQE